jgi:hypothetical protein
MDSLTTSAVLGLVLLAVAVLAMAIGAVAVLVYQLRHYLITKFTRKNHG